MVMAGIKKLYFITIFLLFFTLRQFRFCTIHLYSCLKYYLNFSPIFCSPFPLFRTAMEHFIMIIVNAIDQVINNYYIHTGHNTVTTCVSNNNEPLPVSIIRHKCTKGVIWTTYLESNPNPLSNNPPSPDEIIALSVFLQTCAWPLCMRNNKCEKSTIVHQPDVCVVFKEQNNNLAAGSNLFRIPILICEIEGSKDIWGNGKQQSKAIEEACYALVFILENYIIFVYAPRFEFVIVKRNLYIGLIDIEREIVYLQQDGDVLLNKLLHITKTIVRMLVKQLTSGKCLLEIAFPHYRQLGFYGINIFYPHRNVYPKCWYIHTVAFTPQLFYANPNFLPQFE